MANRTPRALGTVTTKSGSTVLFRDNSAEFLKELDDVQVKLLTMIGLKAEGYAKKLCPVGTPESTGVKGYRGSDLRNSIAFRVDATGQEKTLEIGSDVEYAPYVELGTGPHFVPPPEWEQFEAEKGKGVGKAYVQPRPFIRPAIEEHKEEYARMAEKLLKGT